MSYVEKCMYDYLENMASLVGMQMELSCLMSVQGQSYAMNSGYSTSDPVGERASKVLALERRIYQTHRRVKPVKRLKSELISSDVRISQMLGILRLRYFQHKTNDEVIRAMAITRSTYWRRHNELLRKARKYFNELQ